MLKKLFFFICTLGLLAAGAGAGTLYYLIVIEPGPEIELESIESILGKESPVFYSDNSTKLGVFFDQAHRQYVRYGEIPKDFVNALVAAEDNSFFQHFGFDPVGITRAAIRNLEAGRIVQGGSTLTQQTAKNLFKRTERSIQAKLKELLYALRLEYRYSKEKIFEFYANQFYVSGNGHGLGVAARYYFDKKPSELTLVECAFIAGSVKRPNYYNPFIKKTAEGAEQARQNARVRLRYVLTKMLELGMIGQGKYNETLASEIGFNKGQVGYSLDYVMEMVKDAVSSEEVLSALEKHGIDNVSTSGIRIITTVDKAIQEEALYALRHDLSRLDVMLRGYEREEVQGEYAALDYRGDLSLEQGAFLFGTVTSVQLEGAPRVTVDFGRKLGTGVIDAKGLTALAAARVKWQKNLWAESSTGDVKELARQLKSGDRVWVSVREVTELDEKLLDLEKYPKVQGGAIVLKEGAITAVVGGTENRFYNRAVYARRTMGSSFKPFVFAAALQLGWNSSDLLNNRRNVFVFHNQPYFPRPDHHSPFEAVSMSWAGVKSENLASVWLLTHLCDQLNPVQFRDVAEHLGIAPRIVDGEREPYRTYRARIRDRYGIVVTRDVLRSAAYRAAIRNSEADFKFENRVDEYNYLKTLHYGLRFEDFSRQIDEQLATESSLSQYERKELMLRKKILEETFLSLERQRNALKSYKQIIEDPIGLFRQRSSDDAHGVYDLFFDGRTGNYAFMAPDPDDSYLSLVNRNALQDRLFGMSAAERQRFWGDIRIGGTLSVTALDLFAGQMNTEHERLQRGLPYSFEVLSDIADFRIFTGLQYLIELAREMGVRSELEPVLSFPLGSNVVSLLEATRMYEAMATGRITTYGNSDIPGDEEALLIIDRIESEDGKVLYRPDKSENVVLGEKARLAVGHVLENVVKFGTGRKADREVRLESDNKKRIDTLDLTVPLLGKTGTANRYTNASFFGYLPGVAEDGDGMVLHNGYAVGAYVGYDNNDAMRKSTIRISGAAGALPTWIDIVQKLIERNSYADSFDAVDLSFYGLHLKRLQKDQLNLAADEDNGGALLYPVQSVPAANRYHPSILTFGSVSGQGRFLPERSYEPFWRVGKTLN